MAAHSATGDSSVPFCHGFVMCERCPSPAHESLPNGNIRQHFIAERAIATRGAAALIADSPVRIRVDSAFQWFTRADITLRMRIKGPIGVDGFVMNTGDIAEIFQ